MKRVILILAGGSGQRLWPLSRKDCPKQFLKLNSSNSLLEETIDRFSEFQEIYILTNPNLYKKMKLNQNIKLNKRIKFIIEPESRNTSPAIGLAIITIMKEMGDCLILTASSDHIISNPDTFMKEISFAFDYAEKNPRLLLLGTKTNYPHTGYGYIKFLGEIGDNIFEIGKFIEKPNYAEAKKCCESNSFLWNTGILISKISVLLGEYQKYSTKLYRSLKKIENSKFQKEIIEKEYHKQKKISISREILINSNNIVVLKSSVKWKDIGNFNEIPLQNLISKENNYSKSAIEISQAKNNLVISDKLVTLVGVENLIIIETDDALLVCHRDKTAQIKNIIKKIDERYR